MVFKAPSCHTNRNGRRSSSMPTRSPSRDLNKLFTTRATTPIQSKEENTPKMKSFTSLFLLLLFATSAFAKDVKTDIKVTGMTCGACAVGVQRALSTLKDVMSDALVH